MPLRSTYRRRALRAPGLVGLLLTLTVALTGLVGCSADPTPGGPGDQARTVGAKPRVRLTPTTAPVTPPAVPSNGPNIVLITTDDQTLAEMRWLPRTRRLLGRAGATFPEMLAPHPLCCPARAQILTGQYAQNNGVRTNEGPYGGLQSLQDRDNTLGAWLQQVGYRTGLVGKYLNGYRSRDGVQHGWDWWDAVFGNAFGYFDFRLANNGDPKRYRGRYSTDVVRAQSLKLIKQWSGSDRPFFIWSSYYAPHGICDNSDDELGCEAPPIPAPRHEEVHRGVRAPVLAKPSFNESDVTDKPGAIQKLEPVERRDMQRLFTRRIQSLAAVDEAVAATVGALRRAGELEDTVILFTSDNGFLLGEHRYVGKILPYEESVQVPLLVRGPGVQPGSRPRQTVTTVDLAPTIVGLAGAEAGRLMDGVDLMPYARGDRPVRPRTVLIQAGPQKWRRDPPPWLFRGVRTARYTYVRWRVDPAGFQELYDRARDPHALVNRADDPRYRKVLAELVRRTKRLESCAGADCHPDFGRMPGLVPRG